MPAAPAPFTEVTHDYGFMRFERTENEAKILINCRTPEELLTDSADYPSSEGIGRAVDRIRNRAIAYLNETIDNLWQNLRPQLPETCDGSIAYDPSLLSMDDDLGYRTECGDDTEITIWMPPLRARLTEALPEGIVVPDALLAEHLVRSVKAQRTMAITQIAEKAWSDLITLHLS